MTARIDSALARLSERQQSQLYEWIQDNGYVDTVKKIALPEPDGFGIETHATSLRRFFIRYTHQLKLQEVQEFSDISLPNNTATLLASPTKSALHHAAFHLVHEPPTVDSFQQVSRWLNVQQSNELKAGYLKLAERHADLAEKRLALDREKAELNVARLVLKHQIALQEIIQTPTLDDEDKIRAARNLIFGHPTPPPSEQ